VAGDLRPCVLGPRGADELTARESAAGARDAVDRRSAEIAGRKFHRVNRRILAERIRAVRNGRAHVLELGCGHLDFTLEYLRPACASVVATDVERRFPADTELPDGVAFRLEDALDLGFPEESFDAVIALEVIEHVADVRAFVAEGLRVLRPGGKFVWTTPNRLRLTALARYLVGRPIRFPHTYAVDPVLGPITHEREFSYSDVRRVFAEHARSLAGARLHGIWLGVPAWDLGIAEPPAPVDRLAFNWHAVMTKH
jgi:ubiquinone/menaquinone biosynthesis C-methylase UbiE